MIFKKRKLKRFVSLFAALLMFVSMVPDLKAQAAENDMEGLVSYRTHVQTYGWQDWKHDGEMSGTSGEAKRLEGIEISLGETGYEGGISYRTHVQTYGWQEWKRDGQMSGTSGEAKRLEAIEICLYGEVAEYYDVYYRVHVQTYGWQDWVCNAEMAGTSGEAKRLEGIEIKLVKKESNKNTEVTYRTHVQSYGWQDWKQDGEMSGTSGEAKRLEGIEISLGDIGYSGGIQYSTHVQSYGWQNWKQNGAMAGTSGEAKRLEAIKIELYGEVSEYYDVYYRVHVQTYGWQDWKKNGEVAGTSGEAKRLEGIEIMLVKNGKEPPKSSAPKIELSGNPKDEYVMTEPSYVETDKFILFLDKGVKIYGDTDKLIAKLMEMTEAEAGLTLENKNGFVPMKNAGPGWLFGEETFAGIDQNCKKFHIYVVPYQKSFPCGMPGAMVLNEIDMEIAAGEGWAFVHEYIHCLQFANGVSFNSIMNEGFATYVCGQVTRKKGDIKFNFNANYNYAYYDKVITRDNAEAVFLEEVEDGWEYYLYGYRFMTFLYEEYGNRIYLDILEDATKNAKQYQYDLTSQEVLPYIKKHTSENVFIEFGDWLEENKERIEAWLYEY